MALPWSLALWGIRDMSGKPFFLMTDPRHFGVFYEINPWMQPRTWGDDAHGLRAAAASSSAALRLAIERTGGTVELLPPVEGVPDLVFPANAAVVLDGKVLVARFLHPERQREEPVFRAAFQALKARGLVNEVVELPPGVLQEGAGDCIWDADRGFFWAGYGQRSTSDSLPVIETVFGERVVGLELATPRFYHLDTCFCPLAGGKLLYYPAHPCPCRARRPDRGQRRGSPGFLRQCRQYRPPDRDGESAGLLAPETHHAGLSGARSGPCALHSFGRWGLLYDPAAGPDEPHAGRPAGGRMRRS
jgi:N-dimethylarginine dimethylaminohydrolase